MLLISSLAIPSPAHAGIMSLVTKLFADETGKIETPAVNSQRMPLLEAPVNADVLAARSTALPAPVIISSPIIAMATDEAPKSVVAAASATTSVKKPASNAISTYIVQPGDTVSDIAEKFDISVNTILWANGLKKTSTLTVGKKLIILPVSGVQHKVVSGDTILSIANKYKGDVDEILAFNNLDSKDVIGIGDTVMIPDGEKPASAPVASKVREATSQVASAAVGVRLASADSGYYQRPISGGTKTQGLHGDNGVDLADSCGAPLYASAPGTITISKAGGSWNGGYGNYVVISHDNGSQTLYAHMQRVSVNEGEDVSQGQVIGTIGATGKVNGVTGCHVHFEIRNGQRNPF